MTTMKRHVQVWANCLSVIRDNTTASTFKTWFEPIVPLKLERSVLTLQVPSHFFFEYLEEKYIDLLSKTLRKEIGPDAKLEYNIVMQQNVLANPPVTYKLPSTKAPIVHNKPIQMPINVSKEQIVNPHVIPGIQKLQVDPHLKPTLTFDNFIEGECNRLARSAALAVAKNPGTTAFNPLLLYGESGLGKTHLAQAIGMEVKMQSQHKDKVVLYISAEDFQTQYTDAIRTNNKNDFLNFYQQVDVLIIDDVQEFIGKVKTQNTFFHIFNHLHQKGKQLILTCDKAPAELTGLEKRLLSRFKWGLPAELNAPDLETRMKILKQKLYKDGIIIGDEIVEYIAHKVTTNIRELESIIVSMLAQSSLIKREITMDLVEHLVERLVRNTKKEVTIDQITKVVCDYFALPLETLQTTSRKREIVLARHISMYFAKQLTKASLSTIGTQIGDKDHATVLHAYKTVKNLLETDKKFKSYVDDIAQKLRIG